MNSAERDVLGVHRDDRAGPPFETERRWQEVRDLVLAGTLTHVEGARRLKVRRADFIAALAAFQNGRGDFDLVGALSVGAREG